MTTALDMLIKSNADIHSKTVDVAHSQASEVLTMLKHMMSVFILALVILGLISFKSVITQKPISGADSFIYMFTVTSFIIDLNLIRHIVNNLGNMSQELKGALKERLNSSKDIYDNNLLHLLLTQTLGLSLISMSLHSHHHHMSVNIDMLRRQLKLSSIVYLGYGIFTLGGLVIKVLRHVIN